MAIPIAADNHLPALDALVVTVYVSVSCGLLLVPVLLVVSLASRLRGIERSGFELLECAAAALFVAVWFGRLAAARHAFGYDIRTALVLIAEWALLIGSVILIFGSRLWEWLRVPRPVRVGLGLATASAMLWGVVTAIEPARGRAEAAAALVGAARPAQPVSSRRVTFVAVDGLDWAIVRDLAHRGGLPHLHRLLARSAGFELDNHQMGLSPRIWSAIYTGTSGTEPIGGFVRWRFRGVHHSIDLLPSWHGEPVGLLDRAFEPIVRCGLAAREPVRSDQLRRPPLWRVAAAAGKQVVAMDPLPVVNIPETTAATWISASDDGLTAWHQGRRGATIEDTEANRIALVRQVISTARPDLAIYYTRVADDAAHEAWSGERRLPAETRREIVTRAYEQVDAQIGTLVTASGDATIVLVSDHGWELSAYQHQTSPMGMLAVTGGSRAGFLGVVDVAEIAPTVLALAGVSIPSWARDPLPIAGTGWTRCDCPDPPARFIFDDRAGHRELMQRLQAVGYLAR